MTALVTTVFLASVAGSLHCAGMCGVFVSIATASPQRGPWAHALLQSAYHVGRLITYVALGTVAGVLGAALDLGGSIAGFQRLALAAAGAALIAFGVISLLRIQGWLGAGTASPAILQRLYRRFATSAARHPPIVRALFFGLLSTMLPCGWLYMFAATAAGTGSAARGALVMTVFWTGTLPVMASVGAGARAIAGPMKRHVPAVTAVLLVVVGLVVLAGRLDVPPLSARDAGSAHGHALEFGTTHCGTDE